MFFRFSLAETLVLLVKSASIGSLLPSFMSANYPEKHTINHGCVMKLLLNPVYFTSTKTSIPLTLLFLSLLIASGCSNSSSDEFLFDPDDNSPSSNSTPPNSGGTPPNSGGTPPTGPDCGITSDANLPDTHIVKLDATTDMTLVKIPAGCLWMGDDHGKSNEKPRHYVHITKDFYIGETEVTAEQYLAIKEHAHSDLYDKKSFIPIGFITRKDIDGGADSFIGKLNAKNKVDSGTGTYRLPTEAEWEYAARAGTETRYFFGDDDVNGKIKDYAFVGFSIASNPDLSTVRQKKPNQWGLYDIYGNAAELVSDFYAPYEKGDDVQYDPSGSTDDRLKLFRGGFITSNVADANSVVRHVSAVTDSAAIGFRLVWQPSSQ
jgi:formylglycine-generating enzyme required for sulfatase activity